MKKVIRLTESDLTRIVKRVISENEHHKYAKMNYGEFMNEIDSLCEESLMIEDANCSEINDMEHKWDLLDRAHNSHGVDRSDEFMICGAKIRRFKKNRCTPRETDRSSMEARIFKPREYDRLHESDLTRIVKRVLVETGEITTDCPKKYKGQDISYQIKKIEKGTKIDIKGLSWSDIKSTNGYFKCKGEKNAITKISKRFGGCDLQEILDEIANKMDKTSDYVQNGRYNYMFAQTYGITDAGTKKLCHKN